MANKKPPQNIPMQDASLDIWDKKYRLKNKHGDPVDQNIEDTYERVARALASVESADKQQLWYEKFLWALRNGAIPGGRITSNAGAQEHKPATSLINCTVSGMIEDSMDDIMRKAHEAALTLRAGCVSPDTKVYTEKGLVTAQEAVEKKHKRILSYDRDLQKFEMKKIEDHMVTHVPKEENIKIWAGGYSLTTSVKHPVLVYRDDILQYVAASDIRLTDALVKNKFDWSATQDTQKIDEAWFAGAHLGDGSAHLFKRNFSPKRKVFKEKHDQNRRVVFKMRAAEQEVVQKYADFFKDYAECKAKVTKAVTPFGTDVWDFCVMSYAASALTSLFDDQVGKKTYTMSVPSWIRKNPEKYFLPFLAGALDTDGTVTEHGNVSLSTSSETFARQIVDILGYFGVHGALTRSKPGVHMLNDRPVNGGAGFTIKICDSEFLSHVETFMVCAKKKQKIIDLATPSGNRDSYIIPQSLRLALEEEMKKISHLDRQENRFYHRSHTAKKATRGLLMKWLKNFPHLAPEIDFALTLKQVSQVERFLDISETFYDFTVEKNNNYLAGHCGLSVIHNCGIGYSFSTLRPKGAFVAGAGANTSGPLSFMDIYDSMCFTVASAGGRRGAQMGTFDVSHPDVIDFVKAKREDGRLRQFNLSLLITDDFIDAVKRNASWPLVFPISEKEQSFYEEGQKAKLADLPEVIWRDWPIKKGYWQRADGLVACKVYKRIPAKNLWDLIMASTYDFAEPGFILIDRVNKENNLWWCENIQATNPCVTGDTRLATSRGLVRMDELFASQEPLNVTVDRRAIEGSENYTTAAKGTLTRSAVPVFQTSPCAKVFKVTTKAGYSIRATSWHDFFTNRGKVKLKDLEIGDRLMIQSGQGHFGQEGSADLGFLMGLITGDGCIMTDRGNGVPAAQVALWNEDRALAPRALNAIQNMVAGKSKNNREYGLSVVDHPEINKSIITSTLLADVLRNQYGFDAASKHRVPEVIWKGSRDCVKNYIQALFQTDGTVNAKGSRCSIRLSSSVRDLLSDVQMLLANFGVFSSINLRRDAQNKMMPNGAGGMSSYECAAQYELIIDGQSRDVFMSEIGFSLPNKNDKYFAWRSDKSLFKTQPFSSPIVSIEYDGDEAVFDTTQKDKNTVIFNGLVTGQCGEIPLPAYGSCLLGSVNLTLFVNKPFTDEASFDWKKFRDVVSVFTRMLDNVVEINGLPLEQQRYEITHKRRHGMGYLGLGSALTMMKKKYGSAEGVDFTKQLTQELAHVGWKTALELSKEKGPAPIMVEDFDVTPSMLRQCPEMTKDGYKVGDKIKGSILHAKYSVYMRRVAEIDPQLVDELARVGARFSHHSAIAPTGTISLSLANNASNGIEPSFAHHYSRNVIREGKKSKEKVDVFSFELLAYRHLVRSTAMPYVDNEEDKLPDYFISADEVTPTQHVDMQAASQYWIDQAISKTANVPTDFPFEDFKDIYLYAHEKGLKGCTTFRFNPAAFQGVLVKESDLENTTYRFTLEDGTVVEAKGNEEIEYDGEKHSAANLFDALKEGYYGKF